MINENAELYYQQILDTLDAGHISYSPESVEINVGKLIDNPRFNNFNIGIQKSSDKGIKLLKRGDQLYLNVYTSKIPARHEIDSFLSKNKAVLAAFQKSISRVPAVADLSDSENTKSNYLTANSKDGFEQNYSKLTTALDSEVKVFKAALAELNQELEQAATAARKSVITNAIEKLKKKSGMLDAKSFAKYALKLPEAAFAQELEKDGKKKLIARLSSYFETNN